MPDGLYTTRGWQPLPFCEADNAATPRRQRLALFWGAVCFIVAAAGMVVSGLLRRGKRARAEGPCAGARSCDII